jgi:hypothetical protein
MRIKRPIPALEIAWSARPIVSDPGALIVVYPLFFDDRAAVMYRKIDNTPLSATFRKIQSMAGQAVGDVPGSLRDFTESDPGRVMFPFIPSRMTHRLLFAPAGAPSERMIP